MNHLFYKIFDHGPGIPFEVISEQLLVKHMALFIQPVLFHKIRQS